MPTPTPAGPSRSGWGGPVAALVLALALVVGIQLGTARWRFRKQLWQLQGALVGAVAGYVVGRLSAGKGQPPT